MPMKNPPHPGLSVRYDCLEPLGLSVTEAAQKLGVSRKQLSELVNCRSGISSRNGNPPGQGVWGWCRDLVSPSIGLRSSAGNEEGWTDPRGGGYRLLCDQSPRPVVITANVALPEEFKSGGPPSRPPPHQKESALW